MRTAPPVILSEDERATLERWARGGRTPYRLVQRARIVLLAARGLLNTQIAIELRIAPMTVGRWRRRFAEMRLTGIAKDAPRGRRKRSRREQLADLVLRKTLEEHPPEGTHWTTRVMAREMETSHSTIQRIWNAAGLKPHLQDAAPPVETGNPPNRTDSPLLKEWRLRPF
jgi:transposase